MNNEFRELHVQWEWNTMAWALLKSRWEKSVSSSEEVRTICADNLRNRCENKHSGNLLKCILANNEQQTVMLHNYVIRKVQRVRFVKSQNNKFVTLYHQSVRNSVTARVRDSGSHNSSQTPIAFARDLDSVRNSERPQYRGVRKVTVRRVDCILIYLK